MCPLVFLNDIDHDSDGAANGPMPAIGADKQSR